MPKNQRTFTQEFKQEVVHLVQTSGKSITTEGWLYLAVVLDVLSRRVVGWAIESHRDEALVAHAHALEMALC